MKALRFVLAAAILISGCTAPNSMESLEPTQAPPDQPAAFTDTTGGLEGTVVDDSFAPLSNATVSLALVGKEPLAEAVTSAAGFFAFSNLAPASYAIVMRAEGFQPRTVYADVRAGDVTRVQLLASTVADQGPYVIVLIQNGLLPCGVSAVLIGGRCDVPDFDGGKTRFMVPAGHMVTIVETVWDRSSENLASQYAADSSQTRASLDDHGLSIGKSPMRQEFFPNRTGVLPSGAPTRLEFPSSEVPYNLSIQTFVVGSFYQEVNSTFGPLCYNPNVFIQDHCWGAGLTLDLRYTQFLSAFMFARPALLASYSAVPDS